jgi:2-polyprenyl-3-methyl-5-hydroxy-6-metoxy-1,4-benzoquinol methylase
LDNSHASAWPLFVNLRRRCVLPEIMDQVDLDEAEHIRALRGLARINALSGSARILWPAMRDLARKAGAKGIRVLDVACGGGDVPIKLWRRGRRQGLSIHVDGCDRSSLAVEEARRAAVRADAKVGFFALDALADPLPQDYDVIACSLFLHHLQTSEATILLRNMASKAGSMILINDLERCHLGYALAWLGTRILTRSPVVHVDGPLSVRAAFTKAEAHALALEAGLAGVRISRRWPFRFLLRWEKKA